MNSFASESPSPTALASPATEQREESMLVIPVIEEVLQVRKETDETGRVRIRKQVVDELHQVSTLLNREEMDVQRVPVDQVVDQAPEARYEGDTYIIPVVREEVVTTIRFRVVEEIRVTKRYYQDVDSQTVPLRREVVTVEQIPITQEVTTS